MLLPISPSVFLWLSRSVPPPLPSPCAYSSWHNRESGYISLRFLRLPFLWFLLVRHAPSHHRLAELRLPVP